MLMGIEIGGTKLQVGVGVPESEALAALERRSVEPSEGADGILRQIEQAGNALRERFPIQAVGVGFGGPVAGGRVTTSHHVGGWDQFPLVDWMRDKFDCPCMLANDCDTAALAEARLGAGRGKSSVFYVTVGSGIGGGYCRDGVLQQAERPAASEIGHLRPGPSATSAEQTVESLASGWGLAAVARRRLATLDPKHSDVADLMQRSDGDPLRLNGEILAAAAEAGNGLAGETLRDGTRTLGWAIAQMITLLAPERVVVGGGVAHMNDALFWHPLREACGRYVFPPLSGSYDIVPAACGDAVVVRGALLLARR